METDIFNLLLNGGPFGAAAAFFFYRWQKAEADLKEMAAASQIRTDASHAAMIQLQEKRIVDTARLEGIVASNTNVMQSQTQLLQTVVTRGSGL